MQSQQPQSPMELFSELSDKVEKLDHNLDTTNMNVDSLKKAIEDGHFCKWNKGMGELFEFKNDSSDTRRFIYNTLDRHADKLTDHEKKINELITTNKTVAQIKKTQDLQVSEARRNRLALYTTLLLMFASIFGPGIFSFFATHIHP